LPDDRDAAAKWGDQRFGEQVGHRRDRYQDRREDAQDERELADVRAARRDRVGVFAARHLGGIVDGVPLVPAHDVEREARQGEGAEQAEGVEVVQDADAALPRDQHRDRDGDDREDGPVRRAPSLVAPLNRTWQEAQSRQKVSSGLVTTIECTTRRMARRVVCRRGSAITGESCEMLSSPEKARKAPA